MMTPAPRPLSLFLSTAGAIALLTATTPRTEATTAASPAAASDATTAASPSPTVQIDGPAWPPPMRVGMARDVRVGSGPQGRRTWCNYAAHSQRLQALPMHTDPVFKRPGAIARASLKKLAAMVAGLSKGVAPPKASATEMNRLLAGPDGPTLARIALQHRDERVRLLASRASGALVEEHPRLAAFAMEDLRKVGRDLAMATVHTLLAARCDTPAVHATDGLEHGDRAVRRHTVLEVMGAAAGWTDIGVVGLVLDHAKTEPDPLIRALIARGVAELGWLPAEPEMAALAKDKDARVRGEALVALAGLRRNMDLTSLQSALKSSDRRLKAAAIRAVPLAMVEEQAKAGKWLTPLLRDGGKVVDPLGVSPPTTIGDLARTAMTRLLVGPARQAASQRPGAAPR